LKCGITGSFAAKTLIQADAAELFAKYNPNATALAPMRDDH
jgi:hypothetical protein